MSQPNGAHPEHSAQPESVRTEAFEDLLVRGRARGSLTADEVMTVLRDVELSEDRDRQRQAPPGRRGDRVGREHRGHRRDAPHRNHSQRHRPQPSPNPSPTAGRAPVRAAHDRAPERAADGSALGGRADSARTADPRTRSAPTSRRSARSAC